jgi:toxin YoeB
MIVAFSDDAWEDYLYWQQTNKNVLKRVNLLVKDIIRNPDDNQDLGKPEMLKGNFLGYYSRRITNEHRLVYKIDGDYLIIAQCRFHYV